MDCILAKTVSTAVMSANTEKNWFLVKCFQYIFLVISFWNTNVKNLPRVRHRQQVNLVYIAVMTVNTKTNAIVAVNSDGILILAIKV